MQIRPTVEIFPFGGGSDFLKEPKCEHLTEIIRVDLSRPFCSHELSTVSLSKRTADGLYSEGESTGLGARGFRC